MKLLNKVTFEDVVKSNSDTVYYSTHTFWWTDDPNDLQKTRPLIVSGMRQGLGGGLPCDIFGCVLFQIEKSKWVGDKEKIIAHYGSIEIFMAMHHKNFQPEPGDPKMMFTDKEAFINAVNNSKTN